MSTGRTLSGRELTEEHNPLEAGLKDAVSFTKGCYVGQEVIARLNTYDKVARSIVRLDPMPALAPPADFLTPWPVLIGVACVVPVWTALIAWVIVRSTVRVDPMRVFQGAA